MLDWPFIRTGHLNRLEFCNRPVEQPERSCDLCPGHFHIAADVLLQPVDEHAGLYFLPHHVRMARVQPGRHQQPFLPLPRPLPLGGFIGIGFII